MNLSRSKKLQTKARRTSKTEVENKVLEQADSLEKMELKASERRWLMASPAVPHVLMRQADFFQISVIRLTKPSNTSEDASRSGRYFPKVEPYVRVEISGYSRYLRKQGNCNSSCCWHDFTAWIAEIASSTAVFF